MVSVPPSLEMSMELGESANEQTFADIWLAL